MRKAVDTDLYLYVFYVQFYVPNPFPVIIAFLNPQ